MASNSEEPLAGHDIERVFLVIESDTLAEPNYFMPNFRKAYRTKKD